MWFPGLVLFSRRSIPITYSICWLHKIAAVASMLLMPAVVVLTVFGVRWTAHNDRPGLQAILGIMGFAAWVYAVRHVALLRVDTMREGRAWLLGGGKRLLEQLPIISTRVTCARDRQ